jgi:cytochrome d ubiquinol oxidase subunit II
MESYLPLIWALVIGFAVAMYVVLDGFDLGIGILFPFAKQEAERDQMMNTVAPFWDGNETWLVLGGVGLLVAFPVAYAILMPAFYLPVTLMLLGLVLRGVSFEFRWIAKTSKYLWNIAFAGGSMVAGFMQGIIVGGMVSGVKVQGTQYAGGSFDWFTPFNLMCGFAMIAGYALLGATWLMMKTEGEVAKHARKQAMIALYAVLFSWRWFRFGRRWNTRALRSAGSRCRTSCSSGRCRSSRQCFRSCAGIGSGRATTPCRSCARSRSFSWAIRGW